MSIVVELNLQRRARVPDDNSWHLKVASSVLIGILVSNALRSTDVDVANNATILQLIRLQRDYLSGCAVFAV